LERNCPNVSGVDAGAITGFDVTIRSIFVFM
jgi:hypothetical protein